MHIGCKVRVSGALVTPDGDHELCSVESVTAGVKLHFNGEPGAWAVDGTCKLVLRPLSSITDAEVTEVFAKSANLYIVKIARDDDKIVGIGAGGGCVVIWVKTSPFPVGRFMETWNSVSGRQPPECIDYMAVDYLRSINVCVPFMGLDPIAEGWAILEN